MKINYIKKRRHNPKIITNGLVIHLDASNPDSYSGSGTTWTDLSGYGNHFTAQTTIAFNSTYKYFTLNGTSNNYFAGPAGNASSLSSVNTYFTFFMICKPSTTGQTPGSFNWDGPSERNIMCHIPWSGTIYFDVNGCCGSTERIQYSTNVSTQIASPASWGFRSRSTTTPRREIFYNNVSQVNSGTNSTNTGWSTTTSTPLSIGRYASSNSFYWQTRIWAFYFYNRALEDSEMNKIQEYIDFRFSGLLV